MEWTDIAKAGMIVSAVALLAASFYLHSLRKLTINFAVAWMLFSLALLAWGIFSPKSFWAGVFSSELAAPLLCLVIFSVIGGLAFSLMVSQLAARNRELAMRVSLLLEENQQMSSVIEEVGRKYEKSASGY